MTGDIVNLRLARKRKARETASREADERRAAFGRTKAEKLAAKAQTDAAVRHLDAHQRSKPGA